MLLFSLGYNSEQYQHHIQNYEHSNFLLDEIVKFWDILSIILGSKLRQKSTQWNHARASLRTCFASSSAYIFTIVHQWEIKIKTQ